MNPFDLSDLPFFLALPLLLVVSGFFSGSETALFALGSLQRARMTARGGVVGNAVTHLLDQPRMLLITLLFGNMLVNVLYFVISSQLLIKMGHAQINPFIVTAAACLPVLCIIIFGEVLPKMLANLSPQMWVRYTCVPLLGVHRALGPLRILLDHWVVAPLSRLVRPRHKPAELSDMELRELVQMSQHRGVISADEELLLHEVVQLGRIKVRDVMIPRVDVHWVDVNSPTSITHELIRRTRAKRLPICKDNLDNVLGVMYSRQFLLAGQRGPVDMNRLIRQVHYVPEQQRVDQMLAEFRKIGTHMAIVVDEYGGTAGVVTLKDVVERIVGDLDMDQAPGEGSEPEAQPLGPGRWRVSGRLPVHDWLEHFDVDQAPQRVATVGGLVMALLQATPSVGDVARLGNLEMQVETMSGRRIESVVLRLQSDHATESAEGSA